MTTQLSSRRISSYNLQLVLSVLNYDKNKKPFNVFPYGSFMIDGNGNKAPSNDPYEKKAPYKIEVPYFTELDRENMKENLIFNKSDILGKHCELAFLTNYSYLKLVGNNENNIIFATTPTFERILDLYNSFFPNIRTILNIHSLLPFTNTPFPADKDGKEPIPNGFTNLMSFIDNPTKYDPKLLKLIDTFKKIWTIPPLKTDSDLIKNAFHKELEDRIKNEFIYYEKRKADKEESNDEYNYRDSIYFTSVSKGIETFKNIEKERFSESPEKDGFQLSAAILCKLLQLVWYDKTEGDNIIGNATKTVSNLISGNYDPISSSNIMIFNEVIHSYSKLPENDVIMTLFAAGYINSYIVAYQYTFKDKIDDQNKLHGIIDFITKLKNMKFKCDSKGTLYDITPYRALFIMMRILDDRSLYFLERELKKIFPVYPDFGGYYYTDMIYYALSFAIMLYGISKTEASLYTPEPKEEGKGKKVFSRYICFYSIYLMIEISLLQFIRQILLPKKFTDELRSIGFVDYNNIKKDIEKFQTLNGFDIFLDKNIDLLYICKVRIDPNTNSTSVQTYNEMNDNEAIKKYRNRDPIFVFDESKTIKCTLTLPVRITFLGFSDSPYKKNRTSYILINSKITDIFTPMIRSEFKLIYDSMMEDPVLSQKKKQLTLGYTEFSELFQSLDQVKTFDEAYDKLLENSKLFNEVITYIDNIILTVTETRQKRLLTLINELKSFNTFKIFNSKVRKFQTDEDIPKEIVTQFGWDKLANNIRKIVEQFKKIKSDFTYNENNIKVIKQNINEFSNNEMFQSENGKKYMSELIAYKIYMDENQKNDENEEINIKNAIQQLQICIYKYDLDTLFDNYLLFIKYMANLKTTFIDQTGLFHINVLIALISLYLSNESKFKKNMEDVNSLLLLSKAVCNDKEKSLINKIIERRSSSEMLDTYLMMKTINRYTIVLILIRIIYDIIGKKGYFDLDKHINTINNYLIKLESIKNNVVENIRDILSYNKSNMLAFDAMYGIFLFEISK